MKHLLFFVSIAVFAQQVDYNSQIKNKPTLTTINGGSLPATGSITKIDGSGHLAAAVAGTDYQAPGSFTFPFLRAKEDCSLAVNGSTDDTTALSNCIAALPANGGSIVFPAGTSMIANLVITKNNVHLIGQGARTPWSTDQGSTILKYPSAATLGGFVVKFSSTGGYTQLNSSVEKITFDANNRAATGLWLYDTYNFVADYFTVANHTNGYGLIVEGSGITTVPRCGDGSGQIMLDNYVIWGGTAGGGINLGANNKDVCSVKAGKGFISFDARPPYHGIYAQFLDSSSFADTTIGDLNSLSTSSTSCSSNVCTVTTPTAHNLRSQQGVYITSANTTLRGNFPATSTGANTFTIPVTIANGSYTITKVASTSLELGTPGCYATAVGCAWDNGFGYLLTATGLYEWRNYLQTESWNHINQWNWIETSGGDQTYATPGITNATDLFGGVWNHKVKNTIKFSFAKPQQYGINFVGTPLIDYGVGIDFSNAAVVSAGYMPMRLRNNTFIGTRNAANASDMNLIGANSSDMIILGSVFNPAGTRIVFANQPQLSSATAPPCDATTRGTFNYTAGGAGVKDSVQVCGKDASDAYAWRTVY